MSLKMLCSSLAPRVASCLASGRCATVSNQGLLRYAGLLCRPLPWQNATVPLVAVSQVLNQNVRSLHITAARRGLIDCIKDEIGYEKENYAAPPELSAVPAGFKLAEEAGDTHLTLTKEYNGEQVQVDVMVNEQEPNEEDAFAEEEDGDIEAPEEGVTFNVTITKGDKALVFECRGGRESVSILHCGLEPADGDVEESYYTGPVFEELDDKLQSEMTKWLEKRGITTELGEYLVLLVADKEQREYMRWLSGVKDFLLKPASSETSSASKAGAAV